MNDTTMIGRRRLACFCMTALVIQALATLLIVFLPEFYANAIGLPVGAVGAIFMAIRVIDMAVDPVLGAMMDATRTRWGRFRPWLAASAPILALSTFMLFQAERGVGTAYLTIWLGVCFLGFSMIVLSHLAWTATLSTARSQRTRAFVWWQLFATAGQFSILAILPFAATLRPGDKGFGMHVAGWVLIFAVPGTIALALATTPEQVPDDPALGTGNHLREYARLFRIPAVVRLLLADLAIALSTGIANAVGLFYYMGQLGFERAAASALVLIAYGAAFVGTPLFARLARSIGKARALQVGALAQAALQVAMALQPANHYELTAAVVAALGLCIPIAWFLPRAMMADVAESIRRDTGVDRTGLLYACLNGSMKLALGLAFGFAFLLLGWLGFVPSRASDPGNALPLRLLIGIVPALLSLLVAAAMQGYAEPSTRPGPVGAAATDRPGDSGLPA